MPTDVLVRWPVRAGGARGARTVRVERAHELARAAHHEKHVLCLLALGGNHRLRREALQLERQRLQRQEEFPCAETARLNDVAVFEAMPAAKSGSLWTKKTAWVNKFIVFAKTLILKI